MNSCVLMGNLTKDPEQSFTASGMTICKFTLALNRGKDSTGHDKGADYPRCVAFGKTAETCARYLTKGRKVCIQGHIQTGSYENRDGKKVYTTDIIVDRMEFASAKNGGGTSGSDIPRDNEYSDDWRVKPVHARAADIPPDMPDSDQMRFAAVEDDIPF